MGKKTSVLLAVIVLTGLACAFFVYDRAFREKELSIDELKLYAHQGDLEAQNKLGAAYFNGKGVEKNAAEAQRWFRESAEKGFAKAQYNLGVIYYLGQGVVRNNEEAVKWFEKAAAQGLADAQYNLGVMYYQGAGVKQSYAEAFRLYSESAEKGYALAQYNLGLMYLQGTGIPKDQVKAYMYLSLAAGQKVPEAVKNRDYLDKNMPPDKLKQARKLAGDWEPGK